MTKLPDNWEYIRFTGPSGTWTFARTMAIRDKLLDAGEKRVFHKKELLGMSPKLRTLTQEQKNEWLKSMIELKELLPDALIIKDVTNG